jgi:hypothetical protein
LSQQPAATADRLMVLLCHRQIQTSLADLYRDAAQPHASRAAQASAAALAKDLAAMKATWD